MAYSGNREDELDEQALLQQMGAGGDSPVSGTMPVGAPEPAMPQMSVGGSSQADRDALKYKGAAAGFNSGDYGGDVKARTSMKNTWAKSVQDWDQTPESFTPEELSQFMESEQRKRFFPNAQLVQGGAGDKVNFGGMLSDFEGGVPVGEVDVIGGAAPGQGALSWQDIANDGGGGAMPMMAPGMGQDMTGGMSGTSDTLAQILAELEAGQNGENSPMDIEALMAQLGGGNGR
jgi:hypothetical protein